MYQKIAFTPTNATNTLNITLRHKVAQDHNNFELC